MQGRRVGIWPFPSMPNLDKGPLEAQTSMPQAELTRDVWDLDDDQLWEALEALQVKVSRGRGLHPYWGHPRVPGSISEAVADGRKMDPRRMAKWSIPASWIVLRNMAVNVAAVKEAAVVIQTLIMVGVALARWLKAAVFQQNVWEKMQGEWAVIKGIEDPVWGERVQLAAETHSLPSASGVRDGPTWPEGSLPQHLL